MQRLAITYVGLATLSKGLGAREQSTEAKWARRETPPWESGTLSRGSCRHRFPRQAGDEAAGLDCQQLSFQDASPDPGTGRSEQGGGKNGLPWPLASSENDCSVATGRSPTLASCWPRGASGGGEARGTNPPAKVSRNAEQPGGTCRRPPHPNRAPGTSPPMISDPSPRARAARQRRAAHRPVSPARGREGPRGSRTCSSSFPGQRGLLPRRSAPWGLLPSKSAPWGLLPPKSAPRCPSPTTWQEMLPPGSGIWLDLPACPKPVASLSRSQFPHL